MKKKSGKRGMVVMVGLIYLAFPAVLRANTPQEVIQFTADTVLNILKDPALKSEAKRSERREKLREVIYPRFDFAEMAKRSLGPHWRKQSAQEQREFVKLFTDLLETSYSDKIDSYKGEKVLYIGEKRDKEYAEVRTKIVTKKGEEYSINYKLHDAAGEWKVYDVVIENISLVNNYRSQFNRVLTQSSFAELLRRMKAKQFQAPATGEKA